MKIIQITDLHINSENESVRGGTNVRGNFKKLLKEIHNISFDYLVISGDLCLTEGDYNTYIWIKKCLKSIKQPFYIIPGNHDNVDLIARVFNLEMKNKEVFYKKNMDKQDVYFLDTSSYILSLQQMKWLEFELKNTDNNNPIIFMHHPPIKSDVKYMDKKHPLKNRNEVGVFLNQFTDKVFYIFSGHFHSDSYSKKGNINSYITPSNYFQINKELDYFEIENNYTSYRVIEIIKNKIKTDVFYVK